MEINIKSAQMSTNFKTERIYPKSEELIVVPSEEEQTYSGLYNTVNVKAVETEKLNIIPSLQEQEFNGLYSNVIVKKVIGETLNIVPSLEKQTFDGIYEKVTVEAFNVDVNTDIIVSPTEPTGEDRKLIWVKKGKNRFNIDDYIERNQLYNYSEPFYEKIDNGASMNYTDYRYPKELIYCISVKPNQPYTLSCIKEDGARIVMANANSESWDLSSSANGFPSTVIPTYKYMAVKLVGSNGLTITNIQIEEGTESTEYEEYVKPEIYIKNIDDEYVTADEINVS